MTGFFSRMTLRMQECLSATFEDHPSSDIAVAAVLNELIDYLADNLPVTVFFFLFCQTGPASSHPLALRRHDQLGIHVGIIIDVIE